jgi:hypothetical protein
METAIGNQSLKGTLLDRVLRELGKTKMNRWDVAEGLISELGSRQLVTPAEATILIKCLETVVTARVIDAELVKKISELAERFRDQDSIAGTIASTTVSVARAIYAASAGVPTRG